MTRISTDKHNASELLEEILGSYDPSNHINKMVTVKRLVRFEDEFSSAYHDLAQVAAYYLSTISADVQSSPEFLLDIEGESQYITI